MTKVQCEVCCYPELDSRGRCPSCFQIRPEDLELLRWQTIHWVVCEEHGAYEAEGRPRKVGGKKGIGGKWVWFCPECQKGPGYSWPVPEQFKDKILRRAEHIEADVAERMERWGRP